MDKRYLAVVFVGPNTGSSYATRATAAEALAEAVSLYHRDWKSLCRLRKGSPVLVHVCDVTGHEDVSWTAVGHFYADQPDGSAVRLRDVFTVETPVGAGGRIELTPRIVEAILGKVREDLTPRTVEALIEAWRAKSAPPRDTIPRGRLWEVSQELERRYGHLERLDPAASVNDQNGVRARLALAAARTFLRATSTDDCDVVADLVANLGHLAAWMGQDGHAELIRGLAHYDAEAKGLDV
jgi:hypothetical protein